MKSILIGVENEFHSVNWCHTIKNIKWAMGKEMTIISTLCSLTFISLKHSKLFRFFLFLCISMHYMVLVTGKSRNLQIITAINCNNSENQHGMCTKWISFPFLSDRHNEKKWSVQQMLINSDSMAPLNGIVM